RCGACRSPLEPWDRLSRATPLEQMMGHTSRRCAGGRQRLGSDAVQLPASMGGQGMDQCLTKQAVREPVSVSRLDDEAGPEPSIECIERRRLIQFADGR